MKKTTSILLALVFLVVSVPVGSSVTTIYAPDGRNAVIDSNTLGDYLSLGWYSSFEESVTTIYATDGRTAQVFKAEVPMYLSLGWHDNFDDTVKELYANDGRRITVYKDEAPAYLYLGWYETYEETVERLYAPGDISILVYKSEVQTYLALGWRRSTENGPAVALTFDDGPHGIYTDSILNTLQMYDAKATFFLLGCQAEKYPSQVRRAKSLGCEIGNHTYLHPNLTASSLGRASTELSKTNTIIKNIIGENPTLMRPPYGNHNASVRRAAGVPTILWNVDTRDWDNTSASEIANHVLEYARDGNIILMHDIYASTADAVKIIVPALLRRGFKLVTISELAEIKGSNLLAGNAYYGF